jgi:glutamate-ammonia-ligase adenylyltransferase
MRLRPTGKSGSLVIPLCEFRRYYEEGGAQLWERQSLTRARLVYGDPDFGQEVMAAVRQGAFGLEWRAGYVDDILAMRERLEASRSDRDFKRGFGGLNDIEFLVQLLQLKHGRQFPAICIGNTWDALDELQAAGLLTEPEHLALWASYDYLRLVESRLRIVHNRTLSELPESKEDLEKLARRLGLESGPAGSAAQRFLAELERHTGPCFWKSPAANAAIDDFGFF